MKKDKLTKDKTTKSSGSSDIQSACNNIFNLAFDIDGWIKHFNDYIEKSNPLIAPNFVDNLYYHEEKLVNYLQICAREYMMLARKTDRARLAAAKFTKEGEYDLSEYKDNPDFIELTENDVIVEEAKMERIAAIGEICNGKILDIIEILDTSMREDEWYDDDSECAKNILLASVYDENELQKQFPNHNFSERHKHMIDDIFDERVEQLSPFILIERTIKEPAV